jgi:hypothetical protein
MMVFAVGRWLWYLSSLHRFDDLVDKTAAVLELGSWRLEAHSPRLRGHHAPTYLSPKGSPIWASFLAGWPTDGTLDKPDLMTFPLGLAPWV